MEENNTELGPSGTITSCFIYKCPGCSWTGQFEQLDWDITETCMGPEKIEICPQCGSMEITAVPQKSI